MQKIYNSNYIPHPVKSKMIVGINEAQIANNILDFFTNNVRKQFEIRKNEVLGIGNIEYQIPILTSYILNGTRNWSEFIDKIFELKNSKGGIADDKET